MFNRKKRETDSSSYIGLRIYSPFVDAVLIVTYYRNNTAYHVSPEQDRTIVRQYQHLMSIPLDYYIKNGLVITGQEPYTEEKIKDYIKKRNVVNV